MQCVMCVSHGWSTVVPRRTAVRVVVATRRQPWWGTCWSVSCDVSACHNMCQCVRKCVMCVSYRQSTAPPKQTGVGAAVATCRQPWWGTCWPMTRTSQPGAVRVGGSPSFPCGNEHTLHSSQDALFPTSPPPVVSPQCGLLKEKVTNAVVGKEAPYLLCCMWTVGKVVPWLLLVWVAQVRVPYSSLAGEMIPCLSLWCGY